MKKWKQAETDETLDMLDVISEEDALKRTLVIKRANTLLEMSHAHEFYYWL